MFRQSTYTLGVLFLISAVSSFAAESEETDYSEQIAPILTKYCAGCHNADDAQGKLSLESFADLQKGGERGAVIVPGQSDSSRLVRVLTGQAKPTMPPEDEPAPSPAEIALLKAWIDAGAKGPSGREPSRRMLRTPKLPPAKGAKKAITDVSWHPSGQLIAVARFGQVHLVDPRQPDAPGRVIDGLPGKVNSVEFSGDGRLLVVATGVAGLSGQVILFDVKTGKAKREFSGHRDIIYSAALSPDGSLLATGSYDRKIILWSIENGRPIRTLEGHNDAIYDVAFSPDGRILASASGDETCKLWQVATGMRLDTLSQPLAEQYVVTFSPDGRFVVAGGADNRIRVWKVISRLKPKINPLVHARFGHEGAVVGLAFSADGRSLVSAAEDRSLKLWETNSYTQTFAWEAQSDIAQALAIAPDGKSLVVGRMNGTLGRYPLKTAAAASESSRPQSVAAAPMDDMPVSEATDQEPNDTPDTATAIKAPAKITGVVHAARDGQIRDSDLFRFRAEAGQSWMIEVKASRDKSPLDSKVQVLTAAGQPIEQVRLRAVRDSYFTFRGKDSKTIGDFRVHNWQEMDLNQYLYCNGEVVKLWLYPRGPDSGFKVYPGNGQRWNYFGTTPTSHPLHEPIYIVEPMPAGTEAIPNGLPVFPVYFENDDDSLRQWGTDSRLKFTAPAADEYLVRLTDSRGFQGEDYKYELTIRPARPDFSVTLHGANPTVGAGSGREFHVTCNRMDGFEGEIRVDVSDVPPGFHVTSPVIIERGQNIAYGTINAFPDAPQPTAENAKTSKVMATAVVNGEEILHDVNNLGEIKLGEKPKLLAQFLPLEATDDSRWTPAKPFEITITPGETIMARVRIERNGFDGRVSFGNDDSSRSFPHGTYIDNIGLNGLLIVEGTSEREFFITAAGFVPDTTRWVHIRAAPEGGQTSWPVLLHVRGSKQVANAD